MRNYFIALSIFLLSVPVSAQRHELGVQAGSANLVGDIGRDNFILQKPFRKISIYGLPVYAGILYRMNFNPYQTLRFNLGYSNVQFRDISSKDLYRYNRDLEGVYSVYNADAQFEYNFLPVNSRQNGMLSPYIFGGIGGILHTDRAVALDYSNALLTSNADGVVLSQGTPSYNAEYKNAFALSVPFGAGLKYKFNKTWALFGEVKLRYTFTDNIDNSNIKSENIRVIGKIANADGTVAPLTGDQKQQLANRYVLGRYIGNINSNDWVNSVTVGVSYSFGRPPCYCE